MIIVLPVSIESVYMPFFYHIILIIMIIVGGNFDVK